MGQGKSNSSHSKMKEVIILGALALVLVSGLEQNEEEAQLSLSEGTLQREARDADPQRRKRNQKKKKGKKGAARRKSKGRKGAGKRGAKKSKEWSEQQEKGRQEQQEEK